MMVSLLLLHITLVHHLVAIGFGKLYTVVNRTIIVVLDERLIGKLWLSI